MGSKARKRAEVPKKCPLVLKKKMLWQAGRGKSLCHVSGFCYVFPEFSQQDSNLQMTINRCRYNIICDLRLKNSNVDCNPAWQRTSQCCRARWATVTDFKPLDDGKIMFSFVLHKTFHTPQAASQTACLWFFIFPGLLALFAMFLVLGNDFIQRRVIRSYKL